MLSGLLGCIHVCPYPALACIAVSPIALPYFAPGLWILSSWFGMRSWGKVKGRCMSATLQCVRNSKPTRVSLASRQRVRTGTQSSNWRLVSQTTPPPLLSPITSCEPWGDKGIKKKTCHSGLKKTINKRGLFLSRSWQFQKVREKSGFSGDGLHTLPAFATSAPLVFSRSHECKTSSASHCWISRRSVYSHFNWLTFETPRIQREILITPKTLNLLC